MMKHRGHSGTTAAIRSMWINRFKEEYERKEYSQEQLVDIKKELEDTTLSDECIDIRENECRIEAINQLLS